MKFNKFHGLFCTVREFVHEYHMTGRVSEESPEAYNATLAETKTLLNRMPIKNIRVQTTTARTQSNLKGAVLEPRLAIQKKIKGKKRGPQRPRVRTLDKSRVALGDGGNMVFRGECYFNLPSGNLLAQDWQDIYEWFAGGVAPKQWREALKRTVPETISGANRAKEVFTQLV